MQTTLKMIALAAVLAATASGGPMAQYVCPPGYTYYGGVCQPMRSPGYSNPVSGAVSGEAAGAAAGKERQGPSAPSLVGQSAPRPALSVAPRTCSHHQRRRRHAPADTCITTAVAIQPDSA